MNAGSEVVDYGIRQVPPPDVGSGDNRERAAVERDVRTTFYEAIEWFKSLGYSVEPGRGRDGVTLINDQRPHYITHLVVPAEKLAAMADLSQTVTAQQIFRSQRMAVPGMF